MAGPCFENNRRPIGSNSGPQLECDDDSGDFEARQDDDREHWCVFPENGTEINNTRRSRSMRLNCREMGKCTIYTYIDYNHTYITFIICSIPGLPYND